MNVSRGDAERMESAVRLLLNRARKSERLSSLPLANAICNVLGINNPVAAVRKVVEDSFENGGTVQAWLRDLIVKNDLEDDVPRGEAARAENVSRRQFQRFRASAVSTIAAYLIRLVGPEAIEEGDAGAHSLESLAELVADSEPGSVPAMCGHLGSSALQNTELLRLRALSEMGAEITEATLCEFPSVPKPLAHALMAVAAQTRGNLTGVQRAIELVATSARSSKYDGATRFEFEKLAFLRARHAGRTREMKAIAASLRRLAGSPRTITLATLAQVDAAISIGDFSQAQEFLDRAASINGRRRDVVHAAIGTMLRAKIAFCRGEVALSDQLATGAYPVLRGRHIASRTCAAVIARARAALGEPWSAAAFAEELEPLSFDRLSLECERARYLVASNRIPRAEEIGRFVLQTALRQGFDGVVSRAAAALGACLAARRGEKRERMLLVRTALEHLLITGDRSSAYDLFAFRLPAAEFGPFEVDDEFVDMLLARIVVAVPQMTTDEPGAVRATRDFIRAITRSCLKGDGIADSIESIRALQRTAGALVQYVSAVRQDVEAIFELAALAVAPPRADSAAKSIRGALDLLATVPVAGVKTFAVDVRHGSDKPGREAAAAS